MDKKITAIKDMNWEESLRIVLKETGTNDQRVNKLMAKRTESDYRKAFLMLLKIEIIKLENKVKRLKLKQRNKNENSSD